MFSATKESLLLFLALCFFGVTSRAQLALTIATPSTTVASGSEVPLALTIKNISSHKVSFSSVLTNSPLEFNFAVRVKRADGQPVQETQAYHDNKGLRRPTSGIGVTLEPGEEYTEKGMLTKLFVLSPGTYTVQVRRPNKENEMAADADSNTIVITVTP